MQRQPYHLVEYSPWPVITGAAVFAAPLSFIVWVKTYRFTGLFVSLIIISLCMSVWWRDVSREGSFQGRHGEIVVRGLYVGIILFIVREVMFFFSFFWAYFHARLAPSIEVGLQWPPIGITPVDAFGVPLLNTALLIVRGVRVTWAHHALEAGIHRSRLIGLGFTILLGAYFLSIQAIEYAETSFSWADRIYGSCFFIATGFHGLHVIVGTIFLIVMFTRMAMSFIRPTHHVGFICAAWYWHFVDVVWLFLFVRIYWWGRFISSLNLKHRFCKPRINTFFL